MKLLEINHVEKSFDNLTVLKDISLSVEDGEIVSIIGPSGSGKSTLLRCATMLETMDSGEILYLGKRAVWSDESGKLNYADKKDLKEIQSQYGLVFQNFNLFPHFSVIKNITDAPIRVQKRNKDEVYKEARELLKKMGLEDKEDAYPCQLSGGQCQRVAIARALANNPRVLLLDEPLGALDLQLRRTMQLELKRLQKKLGITFIYITHDQEEAINMSDRIVVMNQGQFEQIGTPDEIYNHPKTSYVATFVGNANILKGKVVEINGSYAQVKIGNDTVSVYTEEIVKVGEQLTLAVRSENILLDEAEMENVVEQNEAEGTGRHLHATVKEKNFAAGQLRVLLALADGTEITASRFGMNANIQPGQQIKWYFDPRNAIVVDREFKTKEPADMSGGNQ